MIWSWLFPPRRQRAKPPATVGPERQTADDEIPLELPARIVRPVDGSPVAPLVVSDQASPPSDANAAAAAAAGAALLFAADMAMHGRSLVDIGQSPVADPGTAQPTASDAAAAMPPTGNGDPGSAPPSDGNSQSSGDGQSGQGGSSGDSGPGSF